MHQNQPPVFPARSYQPCDDLCVITTYYNPADYTTKLANYRVFSERIRQSNIALFTIELAFNDQPFVLPPGEAAVQIRGNDIIWQKERLMNLLMKVVPAQYTKILWVDCDVLFEKENWAVESSAALDKYAVIQPFHCAIRLPRHEQHFEKYGEVYQGFCAVNANLEVRNTRIFEEHGHTGFAWGIRREIVDAVGFYDRCISGSGDHLMAHAFYGDTMSKCVHRMIGGGRYFEDFARWGEKIVAAVKGNLGYVEGHLLHLWHGQSIDRRYYERNQELIKMDFDPAKDLELDEEGLLAWSPRNPKLRRWAIDFFSQRMEDGLTPARPLTSNT